MSFEGAKKQIERKPVKLARFLKFNQPKKRKFGKGARSCRKCGTHRGLIRSYGIFYCRRCFREQAEKLSFRKYS